MNVLTSSSYRLFDLQTVSLIADVLSIVGFALTLWVLLETRKLRSLYKLKVRGPSLIRELQKIVSNLNYFLDNYSTSIAQIDQVLGKVEIKLKSLEAKLTGAPKNSVKLVRSSIDQCEVNIENEQRVRRVCRQVVKVLEELKDHQKDLDWER